MIREEMSELSLNRIKSIAVFSIIGFILLSLVSYFLFDESLFLSLQKHYGDIWTESQIVKSIGNFGKGGFLILLILSSLVGRSKPAIAALLALMLVGLAICPIKAAVCRPRPRDLMEKDAEIKNTNIFLRSWSFPSGDTASAFAVAISLTPFVSGPVAAFMFVVAGAVGVTRILIYAHYLSDVLAGAALGVFVGWLALLIIQKKLSGEFFKFRGYTFISLIIILFLSLQILWSRGFWKLFSFIESGLIFLAVVYCISKLCNLSEKKIVN